MFCPSHIPLFVPLCLEMLIPSAPPDAGGGCLPPPAPLPGVFHGFMAYALFLAYVFFMVSGRWPQKKEGVTPPFS